MMHAYDECYVSHARNIFAVMLDVAVNELHYDLREFYDSFLISPLSKKFGNGHASVIAGRSGTELACDILGIGDERHQIRLPINRSSEYWTGWALAYYQWYSGASFQRIDREVPIEQIRNMYFPYHEMDILQFIDRMEELRQGRRLNTYLKLLRQNMNMTQLQLSKATDIPLKTIQQYEQRQKDINKARTETILKLSKALCCEPRELMEM